MEMEIILLNIFVTICLIVFTNCFVYYMGIDNDDNIGDYAWRAIADITALTIIVILWVFSIDYTIYPACILTLVIFLTSNIMIIMSKNIKDTTNMGIIFIMCVIILFLILGILSAKETEAPVSTETEVETEETINTECQCDCCCKHTTEELPTESETETSTETYENPIIPDESSTKPASNFCPLGYAQGELGVEGYYNFKYLYSDIIINNMREFGYSQDEYPYWLREDGVCMLGDYVMCCTGREYKYGDIIPTSLGEGIVCDHAPFGAYIKHEEYGIDGVYVLDIYTNWDWR